MSYHLKFACFHLLALPAIFGFFMGGLGMWLGTVTALAVVIPGDLLGPPDVSIPSRPKAWLLNLQLFAALPLIIVLLIPLMWMASSGDPLGLGQWVLSLTGFDMFAAREATTWWHYLGGFSTASLFIGVIATVVAHELTHRTWSRPAMWVGRWLLAFSYDTAFAIEHVYGHHVYVGTERDPATAPRGRSVYAHILISTLQGHRSARHLEAQRLSRRGKAVVSPRNRYLRGWLMSLALTAAVAWVFGAIAAVYFVACALGAKALLEIVNYMEHYGLIRLDGEPCEPRHSWNSNCTISSWALFNLTRHSDHHAHGEKPYWELKAYEHAPMMISGYLSTIVLTLIPPLWHRLMAPRLRDWDQRYANPSERQAAQEANRRSGQTAFNWRLPAGGH